MIIDVLDKGYVELLSTNPHSSQVEHMFQAITNAARTSYLDDSKGYDSDLRLLKYLWNNKHHSPFEMINFTFRIKLPIVAQNQWVRHRMGSFNIQSYRYVDFDENDFYIPKYFRIPSDRNKQGSKDEESKYSNVFMLLYLKHLEDSTSIYKGMIEKGIAREQARLVLPSYAMYSTMIWNVNLRSLINFINLRCDDHAQFEIREYAFVIKDIVTDLLPEVIEIVT